MTIGTVLRYLIGNRQAILSLASSRWTLVVGALFVLSAGFAREYDGEYLLAEPWYLFLPLGASLAAATVLFLVASVGILWMSCLRANSLNKVFSAFLTSYLAFLGLFWMTAPLAWLYAVPYERFLSPLDAMRANLWTLGIVATWRVALMVRVLTVLLGYPWWASLCIVMTFADGVALIAIEFLPFPMIEGMSGLGGVQLSESEELVRNIARKICALGTCSFPLWAVGAIGGYVVRLLGAKSLPATFSSSTPLHPGLWVLAYVSVLVWIGPLLFTQKEQRLRFEVEQHVKRGEISKALDILSAHPLKEFPPQWDPPPQSTYKEMRSDSHLILDIWEEIVRRPVLPEVRAIYLEKLRVMLLGGHYRDEDVSRIVQLLKSLPEKEQLLDDIDKEGGGYRVVKRFREDRSGPLPKK